MPKLAKKPIYAYSWTTKPSLFSYYSLNAFIRCIPIFLNPWLITRIHLDLTYPQLLIMHPGVTYFYHASLARACFPPSPKRWPVSISISCQPTSVTIFLYLLRKSHTYHRAHCLKKVALLPSPSFPSSILLRPTQLPGQGLLFLTHGFF